MLQGDEYRIPICVTLDGQPIDEDEVEKAEICIGSLKKNYPEEVQFIDGTFMFPLTQEETFKMNGSQYCQIRIKFRSGDVIGNDVGYISVEESISKAIL